MLELTGKPVSPGIVIGEVLRYIPFVPVLTTGRLEAAEREPALVRYGETLNEAEAELNRLEAELKERDPEKAKIMAAHRDILQDPAMDEEVRELVENGGVSPDAAVAQVYDTYAGVLAKSRNPMMRERASDLKDVKNRFLRCWAGAAPVCLDRLPGSVIVVADDLYPSDTVSLDRAHVLGIITQVGGSTSHTAIIARSYEIPAVLGVTGAMETLRTGQTVILDAVEGRVLPDPSSGEENEYALRAQALAEERRETRRYLDTRPVTRDGTRVEVRLNVAAAGEEELQGARYADGCGLFRTEFLYLNADHLPDEEEQTAAYSKVLRAFGDKPVVLRTMDIGGDKKLPLLEMAREENPFLGVRGLRLSLEREALFRTQLRAALRASVQGRLKLMFPMVGALQEVRRAKEILAEEEAALDALGVPWDRGVEVGIMVEVPSIALIADLVAPEVDFVSVGTNDLTQYLCAADRMDPGVRRYYQEYHPALFRVLGQLADAFGAAGKSVSVCGELGGDPLAIPVLVGLGIRKLSMGLASIPAAKRVIGSLELGEARELARQVRDRKTDQEVRDCLTDFARRN